MPDHALTIDGHDIALSNQDKVLYPDDGVTKGDVIDYYRRVADVLLPHLDGRPLTLRRSPDGVDHGGFIQQHADAHVPDWVTTAEVPARGDADTVRHVLCQDEATLVYLANLAALELHRWLARSATPDRPDLVVVDLDPPEDVAVGDLRTAVTAVRAAFDEAKLVPFVQTTGSRGFHVVAPLDGTSDEETVRLAIRRLADDLAAREPDQFTTEQRKAKRAGRIFLDTNRNGYGQTAVAPYSLRARPGAPVATPIEWDELSTATPDKYTLRSIPRRLARKADPWQDIREHARTLS